VIYKNYLKYDNKGEYYCEKMFEKKKKLWEGTLGWLSIQNKKITLTNEEIL
jgi:hypothetical protein